ncbi:GFA family protein [Streptomyces sp. NPDC002671]
MGPTCPSCTGDHLMNATPDAESQGAETDGERTGGCLCGRIRLTTRGPAVFAHTCACRHCQKLGGTPVMWWVGFETVTWTGEGGEPTWYETFEGEAKRGFCPTCGSRLAAIDSDIPEIASTSPLSTTPAAQTSCRSTRPSARTPCTGCPQCRKPSTARPVDRLSTGRQRHLLPRWPRPASRSRPRAGARTLGPGPAEGHAQRGRQRTLQEPCGSPGDAQSPRLQRGAGLLPRASALSCGARFVAVCQLGGVPERDRHGLPRSWSPTFQVWVSAGHS